MASAPFRPFDELLDQEAALRRLREAVSGADDGGREEVPAGALRVGDVICVESGDVVPADARLLDCGDLEVDESGLTGESQAVAKDVPATPGAVLADRTCMLHEGTSVVAGHGRAVVVAVGAATAAGRATAAAGVAAPPAGVQARLGELTRSVLPLTLAGGGAVVGQVDAQDARRADQPLGRTDDQRALGRRERRVGEQRREQGAEVARRSVGGGRCRH